MFYKALLAVLGLCVAFEIKCPEPAQWSMRAGLHCPNSSLYYCLQSIDGNTRINVENCSRVDFEAPGKRIVIRWNFDAFYCTDDKYQPIKYWTNVSSDCLFLTSTCAEEGQVLHSVDRYHEYDTSCRCDHTKGYDFVTRPKNPCFCIPSEEDCSCYKKRCSTKNLTLSSDYKCIDEIPKGALDLCIVFNITRVRSLKVIFLMLHEINNTDNVEKEISPTNPVAVLVVITIFTCTCVVCSCFGNDKYCTKDYFTRPLQNQTCIEGFDALFECEICEILRDNKEVKWMKDGNKINASEKYIMDIKGKLLRLRVINTQFADQGKYSVKVYNCIQTKQLIVTDYFTRPLQSQTCIEGFDALFECEICKILGDNKEVKWMKDGKEINASEKYKMDLKGKLLRLRVINTQFADQGKYSIKVNNCIQTKQLIVTDVDTKEERRFIRIFLIGKNGVGKTSLLRRLMKERFDENEKSTDGINIDVCRCKIRESDKKWVIQKDSDAKNALVTRLKEAINQTKNKTQIDDIGVNIISNVDDAKDDLNRKIAMNDGDTQDSDAKTSLKNQLKEETSIHQRENKTQIEKPGVDIKSDDSNDDLNQQTDMQYENTQNLRRAQVDAVHSAITQTTQTLTGELIGQISDDLDAFLKDVHTSGVLGGTFYDIGFWDFAGEREYYETHQTFLNANALFLLVTCVSDHIQDQTQDPVLKSVADYISFWFNTVHSCAIGNNETLDEKSKWNPPIIVVCTGIDKWNCKTKDELKEKQNTFWNEFKKHMPVIHQQHFRTICFVSNREPDEDDFQQLRNHMFRFGSTLKTCNEKISVKWIPFELLLNAVKDAKVNILSFSDIKVLALKCSIEYEDEVKRFLEYQHKVGNIIYFKTIQDYIILSQQWLADAFKCLVTNKVDHGLQTTASWRKLTSTGELEETLIAELFKKEEEREFSKYKTHILNVMEAFDILAKPPDSHTYYMPCMITKQISLDNLYKRFCIEKDKDCTPWLILEFNFMPFSMFQHVVVYLLRKYCLCDELSAHEKTIYHDKAVFYLEKSKCFQLVTCYVQNAIALQIWKHRNLTSNVCKDLVDFLKKAIKKINRKSVAKNGDYTKKAKCVNGDIYSDKFRVTFEDLLDSKNGEYLCEEHCKMHTTEDLLKTWFERYENTAVVPPVRTTSSLHTTVTELSKQQVDWKKALIQNRVAIVKGLANPVDVADILYSGKILTEEMWDSIVGENEIDKKTKMLLDILERQGSKAVCRLYYAFKETQNETLADLLIPYVKEIETFENLNEHKTTNMGKKKEALLVVALDLGTTYSGYAYSTRADYKGHPDKIFTNTKWTCEEGFASDKTPTAILFDEQGIFHSFGYEAEETYAELCADGKAEEYTYFTRFKMKLFQDEVNSSDSIMNPNGKNRSLISRDLLIAGTNGRTMKALKVFSESIRYLKNHFLKCSKAIFGFKEDDVHWVLTVPAIWKDNAKQFMREAAVQAGINQDLLSMAYEPEAAAIYCKDLKVQKKEGTEAGPLWSVEPRGQFLVINCGGGIVDVTSYEVQENSALKEINRPTGGPWGGIYVDKEFFAFIEELFGTDVMEEFKENYPEDDLDLKGKFEAKKRGFSLKSAKRTTLSIPSTLFETFKKMRNDVSFKDYIQKSDYGNVIKVQHDKLRFDYKVIEKFFQNPVNSIIDHIKGLLDENGRHIKHILMVGGFSDSPILHEKVKEQFKHLNVIVPNEAVTAVLKGAVMYGHSPDLISERVCPRTYGVTGSVPFDEKKHPPRFRAFVDGEFLCTDIFKTIVQSGKPLTVGKSKFDILCRPSHAFDTVATVELYESYHKNPSYTFDEGVKRLGIIEVPIPDISRGKKRQIQISLHFGYTELFVTAFDVGTNRKTEVKFDCLLR